MRPIKALEHPLDRNKMQDALEIVQYQGLTMIKKNMSVIIMAAIMFCILIALGAWQWKRLAWKEHIITRIEQNSQAVPVDLSEVITKADSSEGGLNKAEYSRVKLSGRYDHNRQVYFFGQKQGAVGWFLYTPLEYKPSFFVFVNRGFFPGSRPQTALNKLGFPKDEVNIVGLFRMGLEHKPSRFTPQNNIEKKQYFWRSIEEMTQGAFGNAARVMPIKGKYDTHSVPTLLAFSVDLERNDHNKKWPQAGTTILKPANNHFTYMMTWFSFALTLLIITGIFLAGQNRKG